MKKLVSRNSVIIILSVMVVFGLIGATVAKATKPTTTSTGHDRTIVGVYQDSDINQSDNTPALFISQSSSNVRQIAQTQNGLPIAGNSAPVIQTTHQTQMVTLSGHITYEASGNACGIGPTGICHMSVQKNITIVNSNTNQSYTVTSAVDGSFTVQLVAGAYLVIPEAGSGVNPSAPTQTINLAANSSVNVDISYGAIATTNALSINPN